MNMLAYKCPHCGALADLPEDKIGAVVNCPRAACGKPFRADVPSGGPVGNDDGRVHRTIERTKNDEEVVRVIHPAMRGRPLYLLGAWLLVLAGLALFLMAWLDPEALPESLRGGFTIATGLIVAAAGILWLGVWKLILMFRRLTITSERSLFEEGFISRRTSEVRHTDVRNLQIDQNLGQRLLDIGDLAVSSAGQEDFEVVIRSIADPNGAASLIRERQHPERQTATAT